MTKWDLFQEFTKNVFNVCTQVNMAHDINRKNGQKLNNSPKNSKGSFLKIIYHFMIHTNQNQQIKK